MQEQFGRYVLLERIAVGGMAEIFRAKAPGLGGFEKILAIKRLHPRYSQDAEFIDMLDDVMVQLACCIDNRHINAILTDERKEQHPLMSCRILRRIHASVYKSRELDECITEAQKIAAAGPTWTASGLTSWLSELDTAHLDIRHCGATEGTADACIVKPALKALGKAPPAVQDKPVDWKFKASTWLHGLETNPASLPFHAFQAAVEGYIKEMPPDASTSNTTTPPGMALFAEAASYPMPSLT